MMKQNGALRITDGGSIFFRRYRFISESSFFVENMYGLLCPYEQKEKRREEK